MGAFDGAAPGLAGFAAAVRISNDPVMAELMKLLGGPQPNPFQMPASHVPGAASMGGGGQRPQQASGMGSMMGGLQQLMKLFGGSGGGASGGVPEGWDSVYDTGSTPQFEGMWNPSPMAPGG